MYYNFWLAKPYGLANQQLCWIQIYKILEKNTKTVLQNGWWIRTQGAYLATIINQFPHNDTFWRLWDTSRLKTLWEKEKLLVTSNFSFSHSVFYLFG